MWLATDKNGAEVIAEASVEIKEGEVTNASADLKAEMLVDNVGNASDDGNTAEIYGDKVSGKVQVRNTSDKMWTGTLRLIIFDNSRNSTRLQSIFYADQEQAIPAGATVEIPFDQPGTQGLKYSVQLRKAGESTSIVVSPIYTLLPGYVEYYADGTQKGMAPTETIEVGDDVVAVNLAGADLSSVTTITPNSNPNTLYVFSADATVPENLNDRNVVKGNEAETITLVDGHAFYVPVSFTAKSISYSRVPSRLTDGSGYWESIALPFDVVKVTCPGINNSLADDEVDFFHSATDSGKDFWVRGFTESEGANGIFGFTEQMKGYVPYIVAFPGNKWGEEYSFEGKTVTFWGENAMLYADPRIVSGSDYYCYEGTLTGHSAENIYLLDDAGRNFVLQKETAEVNPFHAYFRRTAGTDHPLANSLSIFEDEAAGIHDVCPDSIGNDTEGHTARYNLAGQRVGTDYKGIVIVNGRKFFNK